jgi:8-oxo-dGTP diphosphatase
MPELRVVCGALIRDGCVLVTRRGPGGAAAGCWELPGGKVEVGESDEAALARELHEELRLDVRVGAWLAEGVHAYPTVRVRLVAYACTDRGLAQEPVLLEHIDHRWLSADALHEVAWAPADLPLLGALAALLSRGVASPS